MDTLTISALTPRIGAEVSGLDLRDPLTNSHAAALKQALADHLVLFFRDQPIDHESHKRFGRAFGPLALHSAVPGIEGIAGSGGNPFAVHADASAVWRDSSTRRR